MTIYSRKITFKPLADAHTLSASVYPGSLSPFSTKPPQSTIAPHLLSGAMLQRFAVSACVLDGTWQLGGHRSG